jgi:retron-type reverse transcriptase
MADLVTYKNFLPQGAPTSGMVANLVADQRFDRAIIRGLKEIGLGWTYTRYSDDIDISHPDKPTREGVMAVVNLVRARVNEAGFAINEKKTRTEPYWNRQKVLGIVVNEKPNVQRTEYMHIRCMIHNCLMHGFASQCERASKESVGELISHIRGKLNYFKQIDAVKSGHLQKLFDAALDIHSAETADEADFSDG